jgi:hypothetical protein
MRTVQRFHRSRSQRSANPTVAALRPRTARSSRTWLAGVLLPISLASALTIQTGCFGSFGLTRRIYGFNEQVSPDKWVRWVVFLAFSFIPVYGFGVLADAIVLNSVEFWTGQNPINQASNDVAPSSAPRRVVQLSPSDAVRLTSLPKRGLQVERLRNGRPLDVRRFIPTDTGLVVRDDQGRRVSEVRAESTGEVIVSGSHGYQASRFTAAEVRASVLAFRAHGPSGLLTELSQGRPYRSDLAAAARHSIWLQ